METQIQDCSYWAKQTLSVHQKPGNRKTRSCNVKDIVFEPPFEFWNIDMQFSRVRKYTDHPAKLPTITLNNWRWTPGSCKQSPVNNLHSSSLQHIILGYTCQCNSHTGQPGFCIISTSTESLPHPPFLDHHCPHLLRKSGETKEDVCTADGKNAKTTKFPTTEISSSNLHTLSTAGGTGKLE